MEGPSIFLKTTIARKQLTSVVGNEIVKFHSLTTSHQSMGQYISVASSHISLKRSNFLSKKTQGYNNSWKAKEHEYILVFYRNRPTEI